MDVAIAASNFFSPASTVWTMHQLNSKISFFEVESGITESQSIETNLLMNI